jgi:hypothetical protein
MSIPKPPFRTVTEELLYNIYVKLQGGSNMNGLSADDINSIAKINAILQDAQLLSAEQITNSIASLKGNAPDAANTLEKLYNIVQGLTYLRKEDIDHLAELNAIVTDADLIRTEDLVYAVTSIKGNVPANADTLEKLYNIFQTDGDIVRIDDLAEALVSLNLKRRALPFYLEPNFKERSVNVFKGKIISLAEEFTTTELVSVSYKIRLDTSVTWVDHANIASLQNWINQFVTGDEINGIKYWIKCVGNYKQGHNGEAMNLFSYSAI